VGKQRHIRRGDVLSDDSSVVRGGGLDPMTLRVDASRNHAIYGAFGVSVFALRDATIDELAQQPPLVRFGVLTLAQVGALRRARLGIEPTDRNPRHFDIVFNDLNDGIERLCRCDHREVVNPYYEA